MNIAIITSSYPPEVRSSSHLMQELAEDLKDRGHKVTVVTSYPQHNLAEDCKITRFDSVCNENGIDIIRIKILPPHKGNYLIRGFSQITLPYIFVYNIKKFIKHKIDSVIVYSPPLTLSIVGKKIKALYKAKYVLNVQDLFPQNAIELGVLKNRFLIKFFERIEAKAYKHADIITVHSENNRCFLNSKKGVPEDKLSVVYNWIDVKVYDNVHKTGQFSDRFGIRDKFVFLFGGVMGPSQGLDLIIKAAHKLKGIPDICFLLVGDGAEKARLMKIAETFGLENVLFKPFVSKEDYPLLVKDADVGLVCLSNKNKTPVVPGKILGYMAARIPVLALLNRESDGHQIIHEARCGYSEVSDDDQRAAQLMLKMYKEKSRLNELGMNGYQYAIQNFSKSVCVEKLEGLLST